LSDTDRPAPNREKSPYRGPIPPMPKHLPVTEPEDVPGDPRPDDDPDEQWDPSLPPEPKHDPNP